MFYYSDGGFVFKNRTEALLHQKNTGNRVFFNYHDDVFSKIDWKIEPEGSLEFHYKMQAQRIRDEYDYVILMYSGGYDSTNVLETFYYNNIKLDKILVTGAFSKDSNSGVDENHNGEIYQNAFPYLRELGLDSIVHAFDYTDLYGDIKQFSIYEQGENWVDAIGSRYSPYNFVYRDLDKYVVPKEYQDKKIAIIWGIDKPHLRNDKFTFYDTTLTSYARFNQPFSFNTTNINFYWDPAYPLILLKQLHTLKKNNAHTSSQAIKLVYNFKKPLIYKSPKSAHLLWAKRDMFLIKHTDSDIFKFFKLGVKRIDETIGRDNILIPTKSYAIS